MSGGRAFLLTPSHPEPLSRVVAVRYVLPLREGGSLPAIVEADDLGTYVVKFTGAGQGRKALVAEVICAGLARAVGLRVPDLVVAEVDEALARSEPDPEIQALLRASAGPNLGIDYLPRSLGFEPAADVVDPTTAAAVVWFDAVVQNVDRSWRNPNLLCWHGDLWLIDHGAALYFAHSWDRAGDAATREYTQVADHVLLSAAGSLEAAHAELAPRLPPDVVRQAVAAVPDEWLLDDDERFAGPDDVRAAYAAVLDERLASPDSWLPALERARARV